MSRAFLCALVAVAATLAFAQPASAQSPSPCTSGERAFHRYPVPTRLAVGRPELMDFGTTGYPTEGDSDEMTYSFQPAREGDRLKNAFVVTQHWQDDPPSFEFAERDGPAVATWYWIEHRLSPGSDCYWSFSDSVSPVAGRGVTLPITARPYGDVSFDVRNCRGPENLYRTGKIEIAIRGMGQRAISRMKNEDPCDPNFETVEKASGDWHLNSYGSAGAMYQPNWRNVPEGRHRFHFKLSIEGDVVRRGKWFLQVGESHRIHEGSDAFVNYCINEGREIRSHNGRLYCVRPASRRLTNFESHST